MGVFGSVSVYGIWCIYKSGDDYGYLVVYGCLWVTMDSYLGFMRVTGAYRVYRSLWVSIDGDGCMDVYGCLGGVWVSIAMGVYACYGCLRF